MSVPAFGLGTFRLQGQVVIDSVSTALELGYRVIDTAQIYENEADVGQAIAASGIPREELFITSKIWVANFAKERLIDSLKESLQKLQTDYLDLTLIHWPSPDDQVPVEEFMTALLEAKRLGLTRQIGISNFTIDLMKQAIAAVGADNNSHMVCGTIQIPIEENGITGGNVFISSCAPLSMRLEPRNTLRLTTSKAWFRSTGLTIAP